jgi:hypothetical protein
MSETPPNDNSLTEAFRKLGTSLVETIHVAWNSPERVKLQQEIEAGLTDVSETLKVEINQIKESPAGQQLKSDFDELKDRVNSGEAETQFRQELLKALNIANTELEKVASRLRGTQSASASEASQTEDTQDNAPPAAD